jgi:hypothetical protein
LDYGELGFPDQLRPGADVHRTRPGHAPARHRRPPGHHRGSAHGIITDLTAAGYLVKQKDGRRNRYQIQAHLPLPEPASRERTVGEVLALLTGNDRPGIELPPASDANGRRATQAELKTPLMPGRQADGAGSAVPDPRAESPDAARAGDPAR